MHPAMVLKQHGKMHLNTAGCVPLTFAAPGQSVQIKSVRGRDDTRQFLSNLGFVDGACISVVCETAGNLIVQVKGARVALGVQMAMRIMVM